MRVAFYPAFRPLDHPHSSGLVSIANDIFKAMGAAGHDVVIPSRQSMEWIYRQPWRWLQTAVEIGKADRMLRTFRPDCWLTYHSYYRGPDLIGPLLSRRYHLPYCIFAGSYATKYRKRWQTWLGFQLNRSALLQADMVFINKLRDAENLRRLLPDERIGYIKPGIRTEAFPLVPAEGGKIRRQLSLTDKQVIVTAASMRPGVKEEGIAFVIEACARLTGDFPNLHLLILGDGPGRHRLEQQARTILPEKHTFVGHIAAHDMHKYYQAGGIFAFPGINESLGMVYLEAQCCGLPVVATSHDGAPEVVADRESGTIVPPFQLTDFADAIAALMRDDRLRQILGTQARKRVLAHHDIQKNYAQLFEMMQTVCRRSRK